MCFYRVLFLFQGAEQGSLALDQQRNHGDLHTRSFDGHIEISKVLVECRERSEFRNISVSSSSKPWRSSEFLLNLLHAIWPPPKIRERGAFFAKKTTQEVLET